MVGRHAEGMRGPERRNPCPILCHVAPGPEGAPLAAGRSRRWRYKRCRSRLWRTFPEPAAVYVGSLSGWNALLTFCQPATGLGETKL